MPIAGTSRVVSCCAMLCHVMLCHAVPCWLVMTRRVISACLLHTVFGRSTLNPRDFGYCGIIQDSAVSQPAAPLAFRLPQSSDPISFLPHIII